jgi:hypothetical protein
MKRIASVLVLMAAVCIPALLSCEDENEPVGTILSGFMTGYTDADGYISVLNDDFGNQYMVSGGSEQLRPDSIYRIVASVELDENKTAKIQQMVPTLSYVAPETDVVPDTMRVTDPVKIEGAYIGGGYLNVNVVVKVKNEDSRHSFIYAHTTSAGADRFVFYHNAYGDEPVYSKHIYISIPLYGYGLAKNSKVFLSCKGYEEDYDMEFTYK